MGPFVISRKCGAWTYELADEQGIKSGVWHAQDLKPVNDPFIALSAGAEEYRNRGVDLQRCMEVLSSNASSFWF